MFSSKRYYAITAKNNDESIEYQKELFKKGFYWPQGDSLLTRKHNKFYAEIATGKLTTCYHDPSVDEESTFLTLDGIKGLAYKVFAK